MIAIPSPGKWKLMEAGSVDYATCAAQQTYQGSLIGIGELRPGTTICVKTSASRYARLVVVGDPKLAKITLHTIVWE